MFFLFNLLRWIIAIFALCFGIALLYYFGNVRFDEHYRKERKKPGRNGKRYREFVIFSPGAILATGLFVLGTVGFNLYISNFYRYNALYGSIGTLLLLMLWIYFSCIVLLVGYELNISIYNGTLRGKRRVARRELKERIQIFKDDNTKESRESGAKR